MLHLHPCPPVAQQGERDPDRLAAIALGVLGPFYRDVTRHFGLVPNFFMSAPDAPEVVEKLWDFAKSAYLENPIPSLFKERLFVFLSRFCQARYCIVRHCGFLVGYGHSSGDAEAASRTIEQALKLLKAPPPWQRQLDPGALRQALGGKRLEYLLAILAFIRATHYWTTVHPGLIIEDDVRELMNSHKELAHLLLQDPDLADTR